MSRNKFKAAQNKNPSSKFYILTDVCWECSTLSCRVRSHHSLSNESQHDCNSSVCDDAEPCTAPVETSVSHCTEPDINLNKDDIHSINPSISYRVNNMSPSNLKLIRDSLTFHQRGIHISNLNIRHLKPKLDDVKIILNGTNNIDVFGICETFLNRTVDDSILNIEGYKFERKDRKIVVSLNAITEAGF